MHKLQKDTNNQYKITLPKQIMEAKGWSKGDSIRITFDDKGNLVLAKEEQ